jgi:hypothetical protein
MKKKAGKNLINKIKNPLFYSLVALSALASPFLQSKNNSLFAQEESGSTNNYYDCSLNLSFLENRKYFPQINIGAVNEQTEYGRMPGVSNRFEFSPYAMIEYDKSVLTKRKKQIFDYGIGFCTRADLENKNYALTPSINLGYNFLIGNPDAKKPKLAMGTSTLLYFEDLKNIAYFGELESSLGAMLFLPVTKKLNIELGNITNFDAGLRLVTQGYKSLRPIPTENFMVRLDVSGITGLEFDYKIENQGNFSSFAIDNKFKKGNIGIGIYSKTPKKLKSYDALGGNIFMNIPVFSQMIGFSLSAEHSDWNGLWNGLCSVNFGMNIQNKKGNKIINSDISLITRANNNRDNSLPIKVIWGEKRYHCSEFIGKDNNINNFYSEYVEDVTSLRDIGNIMSTYAYFINDEIEKYNVNQYIIKKQGCNDSASVYSTLKEIDSMQLYGKYWDTYIREINLEKYKNGSKKIDPDEVYKFLNKKFYLNQQGIVYENKTLYDSLGNVFGDYGLDCSQKALIMADVAEHSKIKGLETILIAAPDSRSLHIYTVLSQNGSSAIMKTYDFTPLRSSDIKDICKATSELTEATKPLSLRIYNKNGEYLYTHRMKEYAKREIVKEGMSTSEIVQKNLSRLVRK